MPFEVCAHASAWLLNTDGCFPVVPGAAGCWQQLQGQVAMLRMADAVADEASKEEDDAWPWLLLLWLLLPPRCCCSAGAAAPPSPPLLPPPVFRKFRACKIAWTMP